LVELLLLLLKWKHLQGKGFDFAKEEALAGQIELLGSDQSL